MLSVPSGPAATVLVGPSRPRLASRADPTRGQPLHGHQQGNFCEGTSRSEPLRPHEPPAPSSSAPRRGGDGTAPTFYHFRCFVNKILLPGKSASGAIDWPGRVSRAAARQLSAESRSGSGVPGRAQAPALQAPRPSRAARAGSRPLEAAPAAAPNPSPLPLRAQTIPWGSSSGPGPDH